MNLTATLELDNNQVKELIIQALMNEGILVNNKDIQFIIIPYSINTNKITLETLEININELS